MFYIRKRSIKYHETSRGVAFVAHLLERGSDCHMGMVENRGTGGATTFLGATPHVDRVVKAFADKHNTSVENVMDACMDVAEGIEPSSEKDVALYAELTNN
jgi:DNA polymerase II small subunit/DNA polymerase delta subunit B